MVTREDEARLIDFAREALQDVVRLHGGDRVITDDDVRDMLRYLGERDAVPRKRRSKKS